MFSSARRLIFLHWQPGKVLRASEDRTCIVCRVVGTVQIRQLLPLFHETALAPNLRSPRVDRVTTDVRKSLESNSELCAHKSKGILLGTSKYEALQRYRISCEDHQIESNFDGGHNMLAIGLFSLRDLIDERDQERVTSWDELLGVWPNYQQELEARKNEFAILVAVEMPIPSRNDEETIDAFHSALVEILSARNNNVQLLYGGNAGGRFGSCSKAVARGQNNRLMQWSNHRDKTTRVIEGNTSLDRSINYSRPLLSPCRKGGHRRKKHGTAIDRTVLKHRRSLSSPLPLLPPVEPA